MLTPCSYPGCRALLPKGGYCVAHAASAPKRHRLYDQRVRAADPVLSQAASIRSSARWKKVARLKLSADPMCEDPHGEHARRGTGATATQVHHIQGLATHHELAFVWSNLMSVCTGCHARIEREVRKPLE